MKCPSDKNVKVKKAIKDIRFKLKNSHLDARMDQWKATNFNGILQKLDVLSIRPGFVKIELFMLLYSKISMEDVAFVRTADEPIKQAISAVHTHTVVGTTL